MTLALIFACFAIGGEATDLFVSGESGFDTFRIPALCRTSRGTLLAFAEGRRSVSDQASNVLVLRRRERGSRRWGDIVVLADARPSSLNNPCALVAGNRVWLMYQRYPVGFDERTAEPGADPDRACTSYVVRSDDDGRSWSVPVDITHAIKSPEARSIASGPGIGIEMRSAGHRGRLVFPFNEGANGHWRTFAVFSDDAGKTWQRGAPSPKEPGTEPNEVQFVELGTGDLMQNARNQAAARARLVGLSRDGGSTWDAPALDASLPDPVCQGSIVRLSAKPNLIAFCNAASTVRREHGTVRFSTDNGRTWPTQLEVEPGPFEYSCLCPLPGRRLGIIYESRAALGATSGRYVIRYREIVVPSLTR